MQETRVWSLGREDPLKKEMATHFSIQAWKIPRTKEPGRLQYTGSQKSQTKQQIKKQTKTKKRKRQRSLVLHLPFTLPITFFYIYSNLSRSMLNSLKSGTHPKQLSSVTKGLQNPQIKSHRQLSPWQTTGLDTVPNSHFLNPLRVHRPPPPGYTSSLWPFLTNSASSWLFCSFFNTKLTQNSALGPFYPHF